LSYFSTVLGFYNRKTFIWGGGVVEPVKLPPNTHVCTAPVQYSQQSTIVVRFTNVWLPTLDVLTHTYTSSKC